MRNVIILAIKRANLRREMTLRSLTCLMLLLTVSLFANAANNENAANDEGQQFSVDLGASIYNRYVWRGTDFGNSPVIQPSIAYGNDKFSIGAWGSYSLSANTGGTEADLYLSYTPIDELSFLLTDYYFPAEPSSGGGYFDYKDNHTEEFGILFQKSNFSLSGYVYLKESADVYFEAGYQFKLLSVFIGAGDDSYTTSGNFNVCNLGVGATKDIKLSEKFTLPLSGSIILNPNQEEIFLTVGITI